MSPLGFLVGQYCGFANVLYIMTIGLFAAKLWKPAFYSGIAAILVGLTSLSLWWFGFPSNEGDVGPRTFLKYPLAGFYFWLGSMAVLSIASYMAERKNESSQNRNTDASSDTGLDEHKTN
jgi:fucose 4-O-acetylase-like acetyltransferase